MAEIIRIGEDFDAALGRGCEVLRAGRPVAIPTETVYGLAADATNAEAVARIYEVKGRPQFNPLICHVCDIAMAERLAVFDAASLRLAERFWPGPLTLVLPLAPGSPVHPLATAGLSTIGLRMPAGFSRKLIAAFGAPLAAPSANTSGGISPTTAGHVAADIGGKIELILDAGAAAVGLEFDHRPDRPRGRPAAAARRIGGRGDRGGTRRFRFLAATTPPPPSRRPA